jgi:TAT (twin-arginine translocation) pathway-exported protein
MKHIRRDFIKASAAFGAATGVSNFLAVPQGTAVFPESSPLGNAHRFLRDKPLP